MTIEERPFPKNVLAVVLLGGLLPFAAVAQSHGKVEGHSNMEHSNMEHANEQRPDMERPRMGHSDRQPPNTRMGEPRIENFNGPRGYQRIERPRQVEMRPRDIDRSVYNHNYRSPHSFRIGPYHPPGPWEYRRWQHGEFLPAEFWGDSYLLSDYWLFGLDIPPVGYEWVRYGDDALLVNIIDGEIMQVVYDTFH